MNVELDRVLLIVVLVLVSVNLLAFLFTNKSGGNIAFGMPKFSSSQVKVKE